MLCDIPEEKKKWGLGWHAIGACVPCGTVHQSLLRQPGAQRFPHHISCHIWPLEYMARVDWCWRFQHHMVLSLWLLRDKPIWSQNWKITKLAPHISLNFWWSNSSHHVFLLLFSNSISSSSSSTSTSTSVLFTKV